MCKFKSGIILKNKVVIAEGLNDSHSDLLKEIGIEDDYLNATKTFVRAELVPKDNEWWVNPSENPGSWDFIVDQDIVPEWFDKEHYEKLFREAVCAWWDIHVLVDQKIDQLSEGYYRLKRCTVAKLCNDVKVLCDNSTVQAMYDSSTVQKMFGSSMVQQMYGSSIVQVMWDSSTVQKMFGSSMVQEMRNRSMVQMMCDGSMVQMMCSSTTVEKMCNRSIVEKMYGSATVRIMCDSTTVQEMWDSATVEKMCGSSTVQQMYGSSIVREMYHSSAVENMYDSSMAMDYKKYPKIEILIPNSPNQFKLIKTSK